MNVLTALQQRRSIRRFSPQPICRDALCAMLEAARLSPTAANAQPLRFAIVSNKALCGQIFPHTHWARHIPDGSAGPDEATQPAAYIGLLADRSVQSPWLDTDAGAAAMSILLAAQSLHIASCWLASVDRPNILRLLGLDETAYALHTLIALGHPAMRAQAVPMQDGDTVYRLARPDLLEVPKRSPEDVGLWFE